MCGFGLIISGQKKKDLLQTAKRVRHRGPDETRVYDLEINSNLRLSAFFNRLAIQDLKPASGQPYEDDQYVLLFNGEIYNFLELRKELEQIGIHFRTTGDTEVLFQFLKKFGANGLNRLNGMFALIWYNKTTKIMIVARDQFGVKPLYFYNDGSEFITASECDTISLLKHNKLEINTDAVAIYRCLQAVSCYANIYSGITSVLPGQVVEIDCQELNIRSKKYFSDNLVRKQQSIVNYDPSEFKYLLQNAVSKQLIADVNIGLLLSGGVDSSLILATINQLRYDQKISICTVSTPENESEAQQALSFVNGFNNSNFEIQFLNLTDQDLNRQFTNLYKNIDLPYGDNAVLLNLAMYEKINPYCPVVLGGDGADEVFSGYQRYSDFSLENFEYNRCYSRFQKVFRSINYKTGYYKSIKSDWERYLSMMVPEGSETLALIKTLKSHLAPAMAPVSKTNVPQVIDLMTYLPDAMLYKVDRASMANSIEARVPFLDKELAEYGLALSLGRAQIKDKVTLRNVLKEWAPHFHHGRPKSGLNFNVQRFLNGNAKELYQTYCHELPVDNLGLDRSQLLKNYKRYYDGDKRYSYRNWIDLNLLHWSAEKLSL